MGKGFQYPLGWLETSSSTAALSSKSKVSSMWSRPSPWKPPWLSPYVTDSGSGRSISRLRAT